MSSVGCSIIKNNRGGIEYVESPYNGEASNLYKDALDLTNDESSAKDIWLTASTDLFKEDVYNPKLNRHKDSLKRKLNNFSQENVEITTADFAEGEQMHTYKEGWKVVAQIRTKPFKNGVKIIMSQIRGVQGQGIGSKVYKALITKYLNQGKDVYSDDVLSEAGEGVWKKLERLSIAKKEENYVVKATPFDENNEPTVKEVLEFIDRKSEEKLTDEEKVEIKKALITTPFNSTVELYTRMKDAFYPVPTKESLSKIGIYNNSEIENILSDVELQSQIKEVINKIKDVEIFNDIPVNTDYIASSEIGVDILGKNLTNNPYINEKEALDLLGGIKEESVYEDTLNSSNLEYLKEQPSKFSEYSQYDRVDVMKVDEDGNLTNETSNTEELFLETLTTPENNNLQDNILFLLGLSGSVWQNSRIEVKEVLSQIEKDAVGISLHLGGLSELYDSKTQQDIQTLLSSLNNTILNPTTESVKAFAQSYDEFFNIETSNRQRVVKVKETSRGKNLVYLETELTASEVFEKFSLLPLGNNVYQKVRTTDSIEDMYENMYQNVLVTPQILPYEAYRTALDENGNLDRSKLNRASNKSEIKKGIRGFVQGQIRFIDGKNNESLEKMYLLSAYFNTKLENEVRQPNIENEAVFIERPVKNTEYLTSDFISDFRKDQIKNEDKYQNFKIDKNGVGLVNQDIISEFETSLVIEGNLKDYMDIKKENSTEESYDRPITDDIKRKFYFNFPKSLRNFTKNFQQLTENTVKAPTKDLFIRIGESVYELDVVVGEQGFYAKLPKNPSNIYKDYNTEIEKPKIDVDVNNFQNDLDSRKAPTETNNYYTEKESQEIDDNIECV